MIKEISISNTATFGLCPEKLTDLKKINFVYGSNGTGKTTISRVIADCDSHPDCSLIWQDHTPTDSLVYNRDFIEKNFTEPDKFKGIFTLGEGDRDTHSKIEAAKNELAQLNRDISGLNVTLRGEEGDGGKIADLESLQTKFRSRCWELKTKYDEKFRDALIGTLGSKDRFMEKLFTELKCNSSAAISLMDLEQKCRTVFEKAANEIPQLTVPNGAILLAHEVNVILKKKVIGKTDINFAELIRKLNNSDWVRQGRKFYDPKEKICPFCQQNTQSSLENSLNEYFDETFVTDTETIGKLCIDYKADSEQIQRDIQNLLNRELKFLDSEKLQIESRSLDSKIRINTQRLKEKRQEPSKSIALVSLQEELDKVYDLINKANEEIQKYNKIVLNIESEKNETIGQVWRYLLDEIDLELKEYCREKENLEKAIANLEDKIRNKTSDVNAKKGEINDLEINTKSIQPTIDSINNLLSSYGFRDFSLVKSEEKRFYKVRRSDGTDAKETLSEGERNFIVFLYFYHLIKGSDSENETRSNSVVVFDDPVSSLDSSIMFIVSELIRNLFEEIRNDNGIVKQIFVLTHNVYFHKEVSFFPKRPVDGKRADETFWTIKKEGQISKVQDHEKNPVQTSYQLLWSEIKNPTSDNLMIQNTMRRILEYYFKHLANIDSDTICAKFDGEEKLLCRSLFSWAHDGSHSAHDSLYWSIGDQMVQNYLSIFKQIFKKTNQITHYDMMMGNESNGI